MSESIIIIIRKSSHLLYDKNGKDSNFFTFQIAMYY